MLSKYDYRVCRGLFTRWKRVIYPFVLYIFTRMCIVIVGANVSYWIPVAFGIIHTEYVCRRYPYREKKITKIRDFLHHFVCGYNFLLFFFFILSLDACMYDTRVCTRWKFKGEWKKKKKKHESNAFLQNLLWFINIFKCARSDSYLVAKFIKRRGKGRNQPFIFSGFTIKSDRDSILKWIVCLNVVQNYRIIYVISSIKIYNLPISLMNIN